MNALNIIVFGTIFNFELEWINFSICCILACSKDSFQKSWNQNSATIMKRMKWNLGPCVPRLYRSGITECREHNDFDVAS